MEFRVLRYFLAIAQEGTVSGAAKVLNVTQPTLSKQLMELEEELNTKLFIRANRKMILTESGCLLRKRAQEIVELVHKSENEIIHEKQGIGGNVAIGSGETEAMRLIAKTALKVKQIHPNIHYDLYSANAQDVMERLDNGLLDFGIVVGEIDIKKYDSLALPMVDTWGILCRNDSKLTYKKSVTKEDIMKLPLIWSKQALLENELSNWFRCNYSDLQVVATYNLIYNAAIMVEEGMGYALCLDKLINVTSMSHLAFVPLEPRIEAPLNIIWKKSQIFSKAAEEFLNTLQYFINE